MWFFMNGVGWRLRHDKSPKPQATSVRSQAPIFRKQQAAGRKPQATVYRINPKITSKI